MAEGGLSIGVLSGRIDLDDNFTATINISKEALDELEKKFGGSHNAALHAAEGYFTAELALEAVKEVAHLAAEALNEVSVEGAQIADVEENFNRLTLAAGNLGEELLGSLKKGTHDTITDFQLMKSVNDNMAAGVKLTSDQYNTLSTGAFALAQAKAMSVKDAFDAINEALLTGKVRGVQHLTGKIDLIAAEDKYAASLGTTADRLTAEEKQESSRIAILDKVSRSVQLLGEQNDGLDEKVAQVATSWHNFEEDLGKTVARSPVVISAFDEIRKTLGDAFGVDKDQAIKIIVEDVEGLARAAVEVVHIGVDIVKFMYDWRGVLEPVAIGLVSVAGALIAVSVGEKAVELGSKFLVALTPEIIAVGVAAGAIYAAFEIGKWQPVSDFFERLGLKIFYGMSSAEAEAAVATHHLTEESLKAAEAGKALSASEEEIKLATIDWHKELQTIDGSIVDWAEHLLASGVSAKSVATEYGLTDVQVKALQQDVVAQNKALEDARKRSEELEGQLRLSREEMKQFVLTWESLNSIGRTYKDTIDTINPKIRESVRYYAEMGVSIEDLTKAFPGLTKAQATAAVEGAKAAVEISKAWIDVFAMQAKQHGDNINDFIILETKRFNLHIEQLRQEGKLTVEMLDVEKAKYNETIDAEIQKRAEQNNQTKVFYQKQFEDAKAAYDELLKLGYDVSATELRRARDDMTEKERTLNHWRAAADDALQGVSHSTDAFAKQSERSFDSVSEAISAMNAGLDGTKIKVHLLSGEIVTLDEAQRRLHTGGSFETTTQNFDQTIRALGLDATRAYSLARLGYSLQEIQGILSTSSGGPVPPAHGPRIPGFREGGQGDFGDGTLAMLHGKEAIVPLGNGDSLGGDVHVHIGQINGSGRQVAQEVKLLLMRELKAIRQFGSA